MKEPPRGQDGGVSEGMGRVGNPGSQWLGGLPRARAHLQGQSLSLIVSLILSPEPQLQPEAKAKKGR
ncbi:unnamed protein product [Anisakis simplex]|uniref:Uncharacterized protein n=1 Tax=Anisakis simplex TaxID=6269 RepID=A0A0M3JZC5_ANISI|nr:unnamed protein product [Anisakis simplex]